MSLPKPPYFAVIFISTKSKELEGYEAMAESMVALASEQNGFLDIVYSRTSSGEDMTISYWQTMQDIHDWKNHAAHQTAQRLGKEQWYSYFKLEVLEVKRSYEWNKDE